MKILIPFPYVREGSGGISTFISGFAKEAAKKHEVTIMSTLQKYEDPDITIDNVHYLRFPMKHKKLFRRIRDYSNFAKMVQNKLDDKIVVPDVIIGISYAALAGKGYNLVYRSASGPIDWELDMWKDIWKRDWVRQSWMKKQIIKADFLIQKKIEEECLKSAKALLCQSQAIIKGFKETYDINVPAYAPCTGIDIKKFAERKGEGKDKIVLFPTNFSVPKGAVVVEEAWPKIKRAHPDAALMVVGKRFYYSKIDSEISFLEVKHDEMTGLYHKATVVIHPSLAEGFPNVILESASCGLPIVMAKIPGSEEYLQHGKDALLVEKFDADGFADAVIRILDDRKLRLKLGKEARRTALNYDWKIVAGKMLDFIERQN